MWNTGGKITSKTHNIDLKRRESLENIFIEQLWSQYFFFFFLTLSSLKSSSVT